MKFEVPVRRLYTLISSASLSLQVLVGVIVAVVMTCVGLELTLRLAGYENLILTEFSPDLGRVGRPGLHGVQSIEGRSDVKLNLRGYHDLDHSLRKAPGTFRVVVLGDSYSAGVQVELKDTYVQRLNSELQSCATLEGRKIEVINLAINGYNLHQFYITEKDVVPEYSPDLLFIAVTPNPSLLGRGVAEAASSPVVKFNFDNVLISKAFRDGLTFRVKSSYVYGLFVRLSDHVRLIQYLMEAQFRYRSQKSTKEELGGLETSGVPDGLEDAEYAWSTTRRLLSEMGIMGRSQHTPILFALTAPDEVDPVKSISYAIQQRDERYGEIFTELHLPFVAISSGMQSYAVEHNEYLNGFGAFGSGYGHWNREGNRVAARLYARGICSWLETQQNVGHRI